MGIDLLPYLRGDGHQYELQFKGIRDATETCQTQRGDGSVFYQVKNRAWEMLYYDNKYIYRARDTSEAEDRFYGQFTGNRLGAIWCPRYMEIGEDFVRHPRVTHYWKGDCSIRLAGGVVQSSIALIGVGPRTFKSGIALPDVAAMAWILHGEHVETYYYARDYGLVGWKGETGESYICEIHEGRPDLVREEISCLPSLYLHWEPHQVLLEPAAEQPVLGIDVSRYQGRIDWAKVAEAGYSFAGIRATVGDYYTDPRFIENIHGARAAGIAWMPYHVVTPEKAPVKQIDRFLMTLGGNWPDLPLVLDVELVRDQTPTAITASVMLTSQILICSGYGVPLIYTGSWFWNPKIDHALWKWYTSFLDKPPPLWFAHYTSGLTPYYPRDWTDWLIWQYSSSGKVPGIYGNVDLNRWNGDRASFDASVKKYRGS